jgi:pimeloyl-ACP methyl ester carboxylesterase
VHIGDKDRITPPSVVAKVAKRYGVNLIRWPNHSHWFIAENEWEVIAQKCLYWLRTESMVYA